MLVKRLGLRLAGEEPMFEGGRRVWLKVAENWC